MNLVIVDDEQQIQSWLKLLLEQTEFPATLKGIFSNGADAFDYCMGNEVDLVITDIRMPLMDGLQLIQKLRNKRSNIRFLILSAYEEFHYASEGMRLGASDYLIKAEITVEDLRDALKRIETDLHTEKRLGNELTHMRLTLNENQHALRSVYLRELLHGDISAINRFDQKNKHLGLSIEPRHTVVFAIGFTAKDFDQRRTHFQSRELLELAVVNVTKETLKAEYGQGDACFVDSSLFAVIINGHSNGRKSLLDTILHYANRISFNLWSFLKLQAAIGISELYGDIEELNQRWVEARHALSQNLFYGKQSIVNYQDMSFDPSARNNLNEPSYHAKITRLLEVDYYDGVEEEIRAILREIEIRKHLTSSQVKAVMMDIVYALRHKLQSLSLPSPKDTAILDIHDVSTFQDCRDWLIGHFEQFRHSILLMKRSPAVAEVCRYIAGNYSRNISLPEVASYVHLNKTYLSGLFKKEMGVNFYDYLTNYRLDKAKELLLTNRCNISELAEKVGYSNPSHFAKVFKKTTGLSPLEYKKNINNLVSPIQPPRK